MAYIENSTRGRSTIKIVGAGSDIINLSSLAANTADPQNTKALVIETVTAMRIAQLMWSTNGSITITRDDGGGPVRIAELHNFGHFPLMQCGMAMSQNATGNISVTITTGGTLIMELSKDVTYNPAFQR